jgi:hypothetical protein
LLEVDRASPSPSDPALPGIVAQVRASLRPK